MSEPHAIRGDGPILHPEPFRHYKADPLTTYRARQAAGWTTNADGWVSTCGTTEDGWALEGHPFPEEPGFAEWYCAWCHYEAIDNDRPSPTWADAYPMTHECSFFPADAD